MTQFYFNAAYPGSGKTEAALRYAIAHCAEFDQKALFILPTVDLIEEQATRARAMSELLDAAHIKINTIHNRNGDAGVKQRLIAHAETTPIGEPELLFITLRAFLDIAPWPNRHAWPIVFVDEAFNPFEDHSLQLVENSRVLTERLELVTSEGEFGILRPRYGSGVRDSVNDPVKRGDAVNQLLHPILSRVLNPNFTVYAHAPSWHGAASDEAASADPRIFIYSEINPSAFEGFETVTFMGAWLQNHAFFRLWRGMGHRFDTHRQLDQLVRNRIWDRSNDKIIYFTERHWTSTYASTPLADGLTPLGHINAYLSQKLHGFEFGWTKNARQNVAYDGGVYIPPRAAGLNEYSHLPALVWLASLLPHPNMWRFLNWRGMSDDEVRMEFYWLPLAQFMTRGADRRAGFEGEMLKVVPDEPAARFLRELFRSQLERAGTIPLPVKSMRYSGKAGRPKGHPNRGGRPRSKLTKEQRREQRNRRDREHYAAQAAATKLAI